MRVKTFWPQLRGVSRRSCFYLQFLVDMLSFCEILVSCLCSWLSSSLHWHSNSIGSWRSSTHSCYMYVYLYMCNEFPLLTPEGSLGFSFDRKQLCNASVDILSVYKWRLMGIDLLVESDLMFQASFRKGVQRRSSDSLRTSENALRHETEMEAMLKKAGHTFVVSCRRLAAVSRIGGGQLWRQRSCVSVVQLMDFKFKTCERVFRAAA